MRREKRPHSRCIRRGRGKQREQEREIEKENSFTNIYVRTMCFRCVRCAKKVGGQLNRDYESTILS